MRRKKGQVKKNRPNLIAQNKKLQKTFKQSKFSSALVNEKTTSCPFIAFRGFCEKVLTVLFFFTAAVFSNRSYFLAQVFCVLAPVASDEV